ncbi:PTS transporter subunit EIIC [Mycoplasmopsis lipofaciens]|uniref:PTS transporter subunit EIIC n=1 Tax=Mycoplasmopsis lipofaciens TaxID=114884 RepID=UPI00055FF57A|nr:PTS transporter subunit EIIC [Mycoplasmopsis lipofaciens]
MNATATKSTSFGRKLLEQLGKVGKTLMFPIAVLPIAAILLRVGAQLPDKLGTGSAADTFVKLVHLLVIQSGAIVFDNLPLLFAIAIGFCFTKDNRGEAAFAAAISMLLLMVFLSKGNFIDYIYGNITIKGAILDSDGKIASISGNPVAKGFAGIFGDKYNSALSGNVLNGIIVGFITAIIYNHFSDVQIPKVLSFFSGRRLIPAIVVLTTGLWGLAYAIVFPWIGYLFFLISKLLGEANSNRFARASVMGVYGFLNRLLIPFGLHHIPNNLFWFQLGEFHTENGTAVNGDIFIFLNGAAKNNPGGLFQAGFFPTMMFGLPALVGAFYFTADNKEQKSRIIAMYGSAAVISMLTGITEPIEFAFMFVSPLLYLFHAILTGIFAFITGVFGIQIGFGFSAGLMDYLLSFPKSLAIIKESGFTGAHKVFANPAWIIPIGLVCGATYFAVGYFTIKGLKLETPGRGSNQLIDPSQIEENISTSSNSKLSPKARMTVLALGGWDNISKFGNCATRLRYSVKDMSLVDDAALKSAGALGIMRMSDKDIQIIIGTEAESLNYEIESSVGSEL